MRGRANIMEVTMNEHGLYKMENKKKGDKVSHIFKNEKDIFDYLNLEYKAPDERIDGRAVIIKGHQPPSIKLAVPVVEEPIVEVPIHINSSSNAKTKTKKETKVEKGEKGEKGTLSKKPKLIIEEDLEIKPVVDANVKLIVLDFKKNGIGVLEKLNENQLSSILRESNKAYYNEEPLMTDNEYDIVKEYIENKYPSNKAIFEVGAPIT
jgi:hypothetical protein